MCAHASVLSDERTVESLLCAMASLASTPTHIMRAELKAASISLPGEEDLAGLSQRFHTGFEALRKEWGTKNQGTFTWHHVFTAVDQDGSGVITFDEMTSAVRHMLKIGQKDLSDDALKG